MLNVFLDDFIVSIFGQKIKKWPGRTPHEIKVTYRKKYSFETNSECHFIFEHLRELRLDLDEHSSCEKVKGSIRRGHGRYEDAGFSPHCL